MYACCFSCARLMNYQLSMISPPSNPPPYTFPCLRIYICIFFSLSLSMWLQSRLSLLPCSRPSRPLYVSFVLSSGFFWPLLLFRERENEKINILYSIQPPSTVMCNCSRAYIQYLVGRVCARCCCRWGSYSNESTQWIKSLHGRTGIERAYTLSRTTNHFFRFLLPLSLSIVIEKSIAPDFFFRILSLSFGEGTRLACVFFPAIA